MGKTKVINEIAEEMADNFLETIQDSIGWAVEGTEIDLLSGDDFYFACQAIIDRTVEILSERIKEKV